MLEKLRGKLPGQRSAPEHERGMAIDTVESKEATKFGTPTSLEVHWDGTIAAVYPDPDRKNYIKRHPVGQADPEILERMEPLFQEQRDSYPGEKLEDGALRFPVAKDGTITFTDEGPTDVFIVGQSSPNSIVYREGGGCSYMQVNMSELRGQLPAHAATGATQFLGGAALELEG